MTSGHVCAKTSRGRRRVNKLIHICKQGWRDLGGCKGGVWGPVGAEWVMVLAQPVLLSLEFYQSRHLIITRLT